ncbi:hypothetical protein [Oceanospirillum sediminis]|uniref:DUF4153 domain-containing protein n=1 Tax=Oceanospirillum sediminis TaxID=2760088 RepID=A0A839IWD0_9GAMM|nr:hypothetical protein [Oceanospirillum sediminis]MBB1488759.1 hypothetical protein [Oceanospirillum sediminis]
MSKNLIIDHLDQPETLEALYRQSPDEFYPMLQQAMEKKVDSETLKVWHARLTYSAPETVAKISIVTLVLLCLATGFFTKIPAFFSVEDEWFYPRFMPLIVVYALTAYFLLSTTVKSKIKTTILAAIAGGTVVAFALPDSSDSDSVTMALIHLPLASLSLLALSFMSDRWQSTKERLNFIRYIGEMGIYTALILLGGMVLTGITLSLFDLIGLSIERWYTDYIVVLGLVSAPIVATYLFDTVQNRQSKFAPILSNVFSPLFLITVLAYLVATFYQGRSPYTDREFLILFNGLLLIILALTIFSISGKKQRPGVQLSDYINVSLVSATLFVNVIALSAIIFRWAEYGITLNRLVVTGANLLIFAHLILLLRQYIRHLRQGEGIDNLEAIIGKYLPVYTGWSLIVVVILPLIFQFR